MRCIWQMDGDKVKGFKCDFSPVDMLMIISGLKYIVADVERHPKDRERAQGIYNQIMLCRYYDEADHKTENCSEKPNNCEPKICDTCRYYNSNIPCGSTPSACKEADKFAEEFVDGLKKLKPTISKMEQVDKDINVRSKDEPQTENPCDGCVCDDGKHLMYCMNCKGIAWKTEPPKVEDEPQTEAFEEPNYYDPALWE